MLADVFLSLGFCFISWPVTVRIDDVLIIEIALVVV